MSHHGIFRRCRSRWPHLLATGVHSSASRADERGSALAVAMGVGSLGLAIVAVLVLLSSTEVGLAARDRDAAEARYAAELAFERALVDLQATAAWSDVLSGVLGSSFAVGPPWLDLATQTVDLEAERRSMQTRTDATSTVGANTPRWQLFGWGRLDDVLPAGVESNSPLAVAVWVADDEAEVDGLPARDANGAVWVRAVAYGPRAGRRVVEGLVLREGVGMGLLRRAIWREVTED